MTLPTYVGSGTFGASASTLQPAWPAAARQANDIALLVAESENQTISLSDPQGFAEVAGSPQGTGTAGSTGSTRLSVYWRRLTSASDTAPTLGDPGDHVTGQLHVFRGCKVAAAALATDNFNRANENPLSNSVWSTVSGLSAMQIVSNVATPTNLNVDCGSRYSGISWPNDQYSKAKLSDNGGQNGPALLVRCAAAATTFYMLAVNHGATNNITIYSTVAGTFTALTGFPVTQAWTDGDTWELRATGTQIQCFLNGTQVGPTVTSSTIASGSAGIGYSSTSTSASVEDWEGGNPTVPWDVTAGAVDTTSDTSGTCPTVTTTVADCLVVLLYSTSNNATSTTNFSAQTNANLANITERTDNSNTIGLGGGHGLATGEKATAGSVGTTAVTYAASSLKGLMTIALAPAATAYNLVAEAGSYAATGTIAGVLLGHLIAAAAGSYAVTGTSAGTFAGRAIAATEGAYVQTGSQATLTYTPSNNHLIVADPGAYAVTGTAASPLLGRKVTAAAGSYVVTGSTVSPLANHAVAAATGSYTQTGTAAGTFVGRYLLASSASYTLTGQDAQLVYTPANNHIIAAAGGSYALTGATAAGLHGFALLADIASYNIVGTAADLTRGFPAPAVAKHYLAVSMPTPQHVNVSFIYRQGTSVMDGYRTANVLLRTSNNRLRTSDAPMRYR